MSFTRGPPAEEDEVPAAPTSNVQWLCNYCVVTYNEISMHLS
jgi:hypothetical protein